MITPTVHLNGTSRADLDKQYEDAYRALGEVVDVVQRAAPNARDYYVQSPDAYTQARDEHVARLKKLQDVRDEMLTLFESVQA